MQWFCQNVRILSVPGHSFCRYRLEWLWLSFMHHNPKLTISWTGTVALISFSISFLLFLVPVLFMTQKKYTCFTRWSYKVNIKRTTTQTHDRLQSTTFFSHNFLACIISSQGVRVVPNLLSRTVAERLIQFSKLCCCHVELHAIHN